MVYNPFLNQLYHGVKGQGSFLNKITKLPLSQPDPLPLNSLGEAMIALEWGSDRSKEVSQTLPFRCGFMYQRKISSFTRKKADSCLFIQSMIHL